MRRSFVGAAKRWGIRAASVLALGLLVRCKAGGPDRIDPHEHYPEAGRSTLTPEPGSSSLRIFTESYLFGPSQDVEKQKMRYYTGYTLYDGSGSRLAHVPEENYEPRRQRLAPGRYLILLDRPGSHPPVFWVTVQKDLNLDVHLAEPAPPPDRP